MGLAARIASILKAVIASLRTTMRWCGKAGTYIVDRTVEGSLYALETTRQLIYAGGQVAGAVASIPGGVIGGIFGGGGSIPAPPEGVDEIEHDRRIEAVKGALRQREVQTAAASRANLLRHSDVLGEIVHGYAAADPVARLALDLDMLPPHVRTWLVSRSEQELRKLAAAGPEVCGEVAAGRRRIVGIGKPEIARGDDVAPRVEAAGSYVNAVANRITQARQMALH